MYTKYNTDLMSDVVKKLGNREDKTKPFQKSFPKSEYTLQQVKIYAIKNDYPIIVCPKSGNYFYVKGFGYKRAKLQEALVYQTKQKYRPGSTSYLLNE